MNTLVSVVIPAYNRERYIRQTVESVIAQTHQNLEVIVVDDGSTDGTRDVVESLCSSDKRVCYIWQKNSERAVARNTGIRSAKGDYIAFLDSDDRWLPRKLEFQVRLLECHPEMVMALSWYELVDERGGVVGACETPTLKELAGSPDFYSLLMGANRIGSPCPVVRRRIIEKAGEFALNRKILCFEDWEMWTRVACFGSVGLVPEILAQHRIHPGNTEKPMETSVYLEVASHVIQRAPSRTIPLLCDAASDGYWALLRKTPIQGPIRRLFAILSGCAALGTRFAWRTLNRHRRDCCAVLVGNEAAHKVRAALQRLRTPVRIS